MPLPLGSKHITGPWLKESWLIINQIINDPLIDPREVAEIVDKTRGKK
jgi:hypothetical protein